jgi:hypothetical protein
MDVRRNAQISEKDVERLNRYLRAWDTLNHEDGAAYGDLGRAPLATKAVAKAKLRSDPKAESLRPKEGRMRKPKR